MSYCCYAVVDRVSKLDLFIFDVLRQSKTNKQKKTGFPLTRAELKTAHGAAGTEGLKTQTVHRDSQFRPIAKSANDNSIEIPVTNNPSDNKVPP